MTEILGGKTVYGASVGILMLETQFPRILGDAANALTWPFPVQYRIVPGATPDAVIRNDPRARLDDFIREGRALVAMGCDGISTSCGFLTLFQDELTEALGVPVVTSSLMQVAMVQAMLPLNKKVGILTVSKADLTDVHLKAGNVPVGTPIIGVEDGREFARVYMNNELRMDFDKARLDILDGAERLVQEYANTGAIILECTNMVPFAADIRRYTGLPVYSIYSLITWFQAGLLPRRFPVELDDPRLN